MIIHKDLANGRWNKFSIEEQLANVGSEVIRTIKYKQRGDLQESKYAFERGLELLVFTIRDPKNKVKTKQLEKMREELVDHFVYDNEYQTTDEIWENYFFQLTYAAAIKRGR